MPKLFRDHLLQGTLGIAAQISCWWYHQEPRRLSKSEKPSSHCASTGCWVRCQGRGDALQRHSGHEFPFLTNWPTLVVQSCCMYLHWQICHINYFMNSFLDKSILECNKHVFLWVIWKKKALAIYFICVYISQATQLPSHSSDIYLVFLKVLYHQNMRKKIHQYQVHRSHNLFLVLNWGKSGVNPVKKIALRYTGINLKAEHSPWNAVI